MTQLSILEAEARRVVGRRPPHRLEAAQAALVALCEAHWPEMRGARPPTLLCDAVWALPPPLADLFVHLHATGDARFAEVLGPLAPAQGLALIVLAEIGRGSAEGARRAFEAMMPFQSPASAEAHAREVMAGLAGGKALPASWVRHGHRPALWRAIGVVAMHIGRCDLPAVLEAIRLLAEVQAHPDAHADDLPLQSLLAALDELGVVFRGLEDAHLLYLLRGKEKAPVPVQRLHEVLQEVRERSRASG